MQQPSPLRAEADSLGISYEALRKRRYREVNACAVQSSSMILPDLSTPQVYTATPRMIGQWLQDNVKPPKLILPSKDIILDSEALNELLCDWHYGSKNKDGRGRETFNIAIITKRINAYTQKFIDVVNAHALGWNENTDTINIFGDGDFVDGEGIYEGQQFNLEASPPEQVFGCFDLIHDHIHSVHTAFPKMTVNFFGVPGNHGRTGKDRNPISNWDLVLYRMLHRFVKMPKVNIYYVENDYMDIPVKGWVFHTRHRGMAQIETAAGRSRFLGWLIKHGADALVCANLHHFGATQDLDFSFLMGGSLKGDDDFSDSMAKGCPPSQLVWGTTKKRKVTFSCNVDVI